jgi:hypothetical protein
VVAQLIDYSCGAECIQDSGVVQSVKERLTGWGNICKRNYDIEV